jgi:hypothetical protein
MTEITEVLPQRLVGVAHRRTERQVVYGAERVAAPPPSGAGWPTASSPLTTLAVVGRTAVALVVLAFATFPTAAAAARVRVRCEDGGTSRFTGFGRSFRAAGMCDVDATCDGICTYALNEPCTRCRLGRGCPSPGSFEQACSPDYFDAPCPSSVPTLAVALKPGAKRGRGKVRIGKTTFLLRCRRKCVPAEPRPGESSLTGKWIVDETVAENTCQANIGGDFVRQHVLTLEQEGADLHGCIDEHLNFYDSGTVSATSFDLRTGECCSLVADDYSFDYAEQVSGVLSPTTDVIPVTHRWDFYPFAPGHGTTPVCSLTATGTMTKVTHPCSAHTECITIDACTRCVAGECAPVSGCRYEPYR